MKITRESLKKKGWSAEEINSTLKILDKAKNEMHPRHVFIGKSIYWVILLLMIIGNFIFSLIMIPLLMTISNVSLYFIIMLIGFSFGMMMSMAVQDIENLSRKHHISFFSAVPIVGIINFLLVVSVANNNVVADIIGIYHSSVLVGVVYLLSFVMPYFFMVFKERWKGLI